jgi:hypothetical protein
MKFLIPLAIILFTATLIHAGPFLTCDPQAGVKKYKLVIGEVESISDAQADGSAWHDLVDTPVGDHDATFAGGIPWTLDGVAQEATEWGPTTPFVLGRPFALQLPTNTSLKDNH